MTGAYLGLRPLVKDALEVVLDVSGAAALARRRMGGRDLVLAYHNVVPDDQVRAAASGHIGLSRFVAQMEAISTLADVVPLGELRAPAGRRPRARVAVTFDDGYASSLRLAVPVLARLGIPATFFVCPSLIGGPPFWWDCEGLDAWSRKAELLDALQGRSERVWPRLREEGLDTTGIRADIRPATLELLKECVAKPGITVGSHTMHHPNLAALDEAEVREELQASHAWLSTRFPNSYVPWVAYPFGLSSPTVTRIARESGYDGAFVLDGGWIPATGADGFALPRLNVSAGVSDRGFRLRLGDIFAR